MRCALHAARRARRNPHRHRRLVEVVVQAIEGGEAEEGQDVRKLRVRDEVLVQDVGVDHHHAEEGHVQACVEVRRDEALLERQGPLTPLIVAVDLGLHERPIVDDLRARAQRTAQAVLAALLAVLLRVAAQGEPVRREVGVHLRAHEQKASIKSKQKV
eukprot:4892905-Pleurochrysis_carterae.AAC.2